MTTKRQLEVLDIIWGLKKATDNSPSFDDIGAALGITNSGAQGHVSALLRKGLVQSEPKKHKTLKITSEGKRALQEYWESGE